MAETTADKMYDFNTEISGKPIWEWVSLVHFGMCISSGWEVKPLKPGTFGYDNLVYSICYAFQHNEREKMASAIHDGWCKNYIYWRDNMPWKLDPRYYAPFNPLDDERRNKCAITSFADLPQDEKDKDYMIADILLSY